MTGSQPSFGESSKYLPQSLTSAPLQVKETKHDNLYKDEDSKQKQTLNIQMVLQS